MISPLVVLFVLLSLRVVDGWGPIFEPLKGGWNMGRTALRALQSSHEEDDRRERLQQRRNNLQPSTFIYDDVDFHQILNHRASAADDSIVQWEMDQFIVDDECFGDECEQECSIPDEYKTLEGEALDVMAYLGIKRAEPLRVKEGYDSAWE